MLPALPASMQLFRGSLHIAVLHACMTRGFRYTDRGIDRKREGRRKGGTERERDVGREGKKEGGERKREGLREVKSERGREQETEDE